MPQIRPITDLRDTTAISEICHKKNEPVFITKNGYGDLVEFAEGGVLIDAREALSSLRRKYFE